MPVGPARILASRSCAAAPVAVMLPAPFLDWLMVAALAISFRLRGTTVGDLGFSVLENLSINASDASRFPVLGVRFPHVWRLLCPILRAVARWRPAPPTGVPGPRAPRPRVYRLPVFPSAAGDPLPARPGVRRRSVPCVWVVRPKPDSGRWHPTHS